MSPRFLLFLIRAGLPATRNRILKIANFESRNLGHNFVGSEHVLCALVRLPDPQISRIFSERGIGINEVRSQVVNEDTIGPHQNSSRPRPMTPRLKEIFKIAESEAAQSKHLTVAQSLLLAILIEGRGVGWRVLRSLGFDLRQLRENMLELPKHAPQRSATA